VASLLETLWAMGQDIVLQEYIRESKGRDIRAIVVGNRVVAVMRRTAKAGEFRSNLHRGGLGMKVKLDRRYSSGAVAATRAMGLEIAGVDMLEGAGGPKILEINSSPGLEGIERATGVDVATAVVQHAERIVTRHKGSKKGAVDERISDAIGLERAAGKTRAARSGRQAYR
jgi:ribosomal protein S6--L-glutamate ligase